MDEVPRWFASDNNATVHPAVMEAITKANEGHAVGYGADPLTARAEAAVAALFGGGARNTGDAVVRFALNGTGANVYALGCLAGRGQAVLCSEHAHILVDETGAGPAALGVQLVPLPAPDGRVRPADVERAHALYSDMHKPAPVVLSLSQPTELGTVYRVEEMAALVDLAHRLGMAVHVDGARLSNAAVALGVDPGNASAFAVVNAARAENSGADIVCFGGTKNGLMFGEAVIIAKHGRAAAADADRLRKTSLQLASKMRFIAAQFEAYVGGGLWRSNAEKANAMARRLADGVRRLGVPLAWPVDTNALFARVPESVAEVLRERRFFYDWEGGLVRWMASWDTTESDIDSFLADLGQELAAYRASLPACVAVIRRAVPNDAAAVAALVRDALGYRDADEATTRAGIESALESDDQDLLVAVVDGGVAGFAHAQEYRPVWTTPYHNVLGVATSPRGRGIGSTLMAELERLAAARGLAGVRLNSRVEREEAHEFYESRGYARDKTQYRFLKTFGKS